VSAYRTTVVGTDGSASPQPGVARAGVTRRSPVDVLVVHTAG
jgi:hypothetical protein